jgi:hypothetical protein
MMRRLFPDALLACISESRSPLRQELEQLAEKVRREAFGARMDWRARRHATRIAEAALCGSSLVWPRGR